MVSLPPPPSHALETVNVVKVMIQEKKIIFLSFDFFPPSLLVVTLSVIRDDCSNEMKWELK